MLGKVPVVSGLLVCLESNGIERISQLAGEEAGVNASSNTRYYGTMTYPISSLPRLSLASRVSCFANSSSRFALRGFEGEPRSIPPEETGSCADGVPLFPKRSQLVNRPRGTAHSRK